jgi:hypothetical protein
MCLHILFLRVALLQITPTSHFMQFLFVRFCFNPIWHRWSMAALIFCRRLAEIHVIPHHQSCVWIDYWWYNHAHLVFSSTALGLVAKVSDKYKSTSSNTIQVKNWQKTIGFEDKLHVISWLEKVEQIVDRCHDVRLAQSSVHTIHGNADRIEEKC